MPQRENWPFSKGSHISETKEATPTKTGVHALDINPYLHEFTEPIPIDKIFPLLWTIANFISETGEATPTKIGMHVLDINPYLHIFIELIPID